MTRPPSTLVTNLLLIAALALLGITALTSYSSIQRFLKLRSGWTIPGWSCSGSRS
jgi:hypothetical protein